MKKNKKILYISGEHLPPIDGGGVHVWEVARGLFSLGNSVTIVARKEKLQSHLEEISGIKTIRVRMNFFGRVCIPLICLPYILLKFHKKHFHVIISRFVTFGGAGMLLSRLCKIPLVLEVNSPHLEEIIHRYNIRSKVTIALLKLWRNAQFSQATKIWTTLPSIVPQEFREKISLTQWGVDTEKFSPHFKNTEEAYHIRRTLGLQGKTIVVFSGTFRGWHGVKVIPQIAKVALKINPDIRFLMVGDGPQRLEVEEEVRKSSLYEFFVWTGRVSYNKIAYYIACSDIGIAPFDLDSYPPLEEFGFYWSPLKVFEYMASGLPIVTVDVGILRELAGNGERGITLQKGEFNRMGEELGKLSLDTERVRQMGIASRAYVVQRFSWKAHCENLNRLLDEEVIGDMP